MRSLQLLGLSLLSLGLGACGVHLPWRHHAPPAAAPVQALQVTVDDASSVTIMQRWHRNALQFDLTAVTGTGAATVARTEHLGWPVRLELLVRPGSVAQVSMSGCERATYAIPAAAGAPVVIAVSPQVYGAACDHLRIQWFAAADLPH